MKRVYVVNVQWKENGKWYNTTLNAFSNKRAAQSYVETKREMAALDPTKQSDHYFIDELACWTHNFLKSK